MRADDLTLLRRVTDRDEELGDESKLSEKERRAFGEWLEAGRALTKAQADWLHSAAERLGVITAAPSRNLFSSLSESERREHLKKAEKVTVNVGPKVLKPPGRK